jgi:hypothetical protein
VTVEPQQRTYSLFLTPNAKFITIDIKDFYLITPMARFEYFRMKLEEEISSRNTELATKWTQMTTFSTKYVEECTASLKPES